MLAVVVAIPLMLFPPVFEQGQASCGVDPVIPTAAESPIIDGLVGGLDAYMKIHNDVERRLAAEWIFDADHSPQTRPFVDITA